ncbi:MAG: DUF2480 family protein [Bacteroidia bacterium]
MEEKGIINKVANSGIITIDLEDIIPDKKVSLIDIQDQLFQGLILREKDFRTFISEHDWSQYQDHRVAVFCSTDAIIPTWAYMLLTKALEPHTTEIYFCKQESLDHLVAERAIAELDASSYADARVVIKGCGERQISNHAFVSLSTKLMPYVKSLMFGEPCSTVPIYKKKV